MEYQKIITLLNNTTNEPYKFRGKNWTEVNDNSHVMYGADSQIKFKTLMLRLSLRDYSDGYILVTRILAIIGAGQDDGAKQTDETDIGVLCLCTNTNVSFNQI